MKQMSPIPDPADAPKVAKKEAPKKIKTSGTWSALEGTSLRDVLEQWGSDAGVHLVWQTEQNFPLPEAIKKKGKFEEAVMDALAQYALGSRSGYRKSRLELTLTPPAAGAKPIRVILAA